jgi:hypothetical protein
MGAVTFMFLTSRTEKVFQVQTCPRLWGSGKVEAVASRESVTCATTATDEADWL